MKNIKILFQALLLSLFVVSCNDFLDELPDNRAELDNATKIRKLLVSAYPESTHALYTELSSDNVDDAGTSNPYGERIDSQMAYWEDVTETSNDDPLGAWESAYLAIAHANQALAAIEELGTPDNLLPEKGEALVARAYGHFVLVNVFCKHYNEQSSITDLGVPFLEDPETTLNPSYERGTVAEVYEKINADIENGLPLIDDSIYDVPSYHFNVRAANAFAARFNLYYQKWQKAKDYATAALGSNPANALRDWDALGNLPRTTTVVTNAYIEDNSNLLVQAYTSSMGVVFGAYYSGARFNHSRKIADEQTSLAPLPWNPTSSLSTFAHKFRPFNYSATNLDKSLLYKIPYRFEYTDPVAQIGYSKTILVPFTTDETLLVRAEANIMLGLFDAGLDDINTWSTNFYANPGTVTLADVNSFYNSLDYSSGTNITQKKELNPKFTVTAGDQENLIHYVLQCRRVLTLHEGLRWFDIKRYGIPVSRFLIGLNNAISVNAELEADDPRKALQIPQDVVSAGITPNPR
ncbi:RagB/SusD family nutrient uptake outer membrane protein [Algibacter lectus]|uniref:SusD-like starch-binding protein associating with outer membrane n=1 Tax=Algibacter lectus TaxID=221126 RepID=A0A090W775_9FLAO|nr:RagB/SusD family nutrient uptake outer membrane protein [Algibacter lectus]MWW26326.1 RagB/SusD family protein [Algibacter lectus]TDY60091.1 SusD-like starch-binding protein associating with outer membrane [Algibacter lectus]GAL63377.1 hypothetical protein JCM19300_1723 [Algibacter lectus]